MTASTEVIAISEVSVCDRARRDYGDLDLLALSMQARGQIRPIAVDEENRLIFGARRLSAAKQLGWHHISRVRPKSLDDALALFRAESLDTTCHQPMLPSELAELGMRLETLTLPLAERRREASRRAERPVTRGKRPSRRDTITTAKVADALGMGETSYWRIRNVVNVAYGLHDLPDAVRKTAQQARQEMDARAISINAASDKVQRAKRLGAGCLPQDGAPTVQGKVFGRNPTHAQILTNIATSLDGSLIAADDIQVLDGTVTAELASRIVSDVSRHIRALNRLKILLREA